MKLLHNNSDTLRSEHGSVYNSVNIASSSQETGIHRVHNPDPNPHNVQLSTFPQTGVPHECVPRVVVVSKNSSGALGLHAGC